MYCIITKLLLSFAATTQSENDLQNKRRWGLKVIIKSKQVQMIPDYQLAQEGIVVVKHINKAGHPKCLK